MLRRGFVASAIASRNASLFSAASQTSASRSYFYAGGMEVGITGATMKKILQTLMFLTFVIAPIFMYKVVHRPWTPDKQFICTSTDKWYSDGTEMKGEEATANLRLQRERIMPIMDAYLEKIEKAAAPSH